MAEQQVFLHGEREAWLLQRSGRPKRSAGYAVAMIVPAASAPTSGVNPHSSSGGLEPPPIRQAGPEDTIA